MKLLTLLRHGKSDWSAPVESDFDRPLKERGRRDAPRMGRYLAQLGLIPDWIVSSPALRARQTTELFVAACGYAKSIDWDERIYAASEGELMSVLRSLPDAQEHVLMVGHNPGFEGLAARLIGADAYGMALGVRMSTAAMAHLALNVNAWNEVQANCGQLQWLITPKMLKSP